MRRASSVPAGRRVPPLWPVPSIRAGTARLRPQVDTECGRALSTVCFPGLLRGEHSRPWGALQARVGVWMCSELSRARA